MEHLPPPARASLQDSLPAPPLPECPPRGLNLPLGSAPSTLKTVMGPCIRDAIFQGELDVFPVLFDQQ